MWELKYYFIVDKDWLEECGLDLSTGCLLISSSKPQAALGRGKTPLLPGAEPHPGIACALQTVCCSQKEDVKLKCSNKKKYCILLGWEDCRGTDWSVPIILFIVA